MQFDDKFKMSKFICYRFLETGKNFKFVILCTFENNHNGEIQFMEIARDCCRKRWKLQR